MNPNNEPRTGIPQDRSSQPNIEDVPIGIDRGQSPMEKLSLTVPVRPPAKPADNSPAKYDYPPDYVLNGQGERAGGK